MKKIYLSIIAALTILGATALPAFADTGKSGLNVNANLNGQIMGQGEKTGMMRDGFFGKVTAVNGTSFTLAVGPTLYTVNASSSVVVKNNATTTLSSIAVGDTLAVKGTVNGSVITATQIRAVAKDDRDDVVAGNGQPVVAGVVSSINGSTIVIKNKSGVQYTVDASHVKTSDITVGETVIIQGTVNGTSIVASSVIDEKTHLDKSDKDDKDNKGKGSSRGFFGNIGQFFMRIFGF